MTSIVDALAAAIRVDDAPVRAKPLLFACRFSLRRRSESEGSFYNPCATPFKTPPFPVFCLAAQARDLRASFLPSAIHTAENEGLTLRILLSGSVRRRSVYEKSSFGRARFTKKQFVGPWPGFVIVFFCSIAPSAHPGSPGEPPGSFSWPFPASPDLASWRLLASPGACWRLLASSGASWLPLAPPCASWRLLVHPGAFWCTYNKQRHTLPQPRSVTPALLGQVCSW